VEKEEVEKSAVMQGQVEMRRRENK